MRFRKREHRGDRRSLRSSRATVGSSEPKATCVAASREAAIPGVKKSPRTLRLCAINSAGSVARGGAGRDASEERGFAGVGEVSPAARGLAEAWQAEAGRLSSARSANPNDETERAASRSEAQTVGPTGQNAATVTARTAALRNVGVKFLRIIGFIVQKLWYNTQHEACARISSRSGMGLSGGRFVRHSLDRLFSVVWPDLV